MTGEHPSDALAAYALGALGRAEQDEVERHLAGCERCRAELRWLEQAVDILPSSVPQLEPPPRVRRELMRTVRAEAREERRGWWARRAQSITLRARPALAMGAIALVGAGVAGYAINAADEDAGTPQRTVTEVQANATGVADRAAGVLARQDGDAVLRVQHLPSLESGDVYQLWVREGDVVHPHPTFVLDDENRAEAELGPLPAGAEQVLVTREPEGGSNRPSGPPLLTAPLG